jgi:hypothetical protein
MKEIKPKPMFKILNPVNSSHQMSKQLAKDFQLKEHHNILFHQDHMNILMSKIYLKLLIGEMLMELTGYHGQEINIFLNIVEVVGLMELQVQLLIESILLEIEPGQI